MGKRHHYVYLTCDSETGRLYWGVRSSHCKPEDDDYFGSHCDETYCPDLKYVWAEFDTREDAELAEHKLHKLFDVVNSKTFANLSCAQWKQWQWVGSKHKPSTIEKLREQKLGENNPQYGKTTSQKQKDAVQRAATGRQDSPTTTKKKQLAQKKARAERSHKKLFHHPETQQQKFFDPLNVPDGWVSGEHPLRKAKRPRGAEHWRHR